MRSSGWPSAPPKTEGVPEGVAVGVAVEVPDEVVVGVLLGVGAGAKQKIPRHTALLRAGPIRATAEPRRAWSKVGRTDRSGRDTAPF